MKKLIRFAPLIGIILFIFIILNTGLGKIIEVFSNFNISYSIAAFLLLLPLSIIKVYKWKLLIKSCNIQYGLLKAMIAYFVSSFIAGVTPGRIGDFIKAFYLNKSENVSLGKSLTTVVVDRLLDVFMLLVLAISGIFIFSYLYNINRNYMLMLLLFLVVIITVSIFILNKKYIKAMLKPLFNRFIPNRYRSNVKLNFDEFYSGIKLIRSNKTILILVVILTIVTWLTTFFQHYLLTLALNIHVSYFFLILVSPIIIIIEAIPISFSGIGTRDAALVLFFSLIGISSSEAISFSLTILFFGYISLLPGLFFLLTNPVKM